MKQIYNFEQNNPPAINEKMLRQELERRRLNIQTALLFLAGLMLTIAIVLLGYSAWNWYPVITFICFGYAVISATGGGIAAIGYAYRKRL